MKEGNLITKRVTLPLPNDGSRILLVLVILTFKQLKTVAYIDNLGR